MRTSTPQVAWISGAPGGSRSLLLNHHLGSRVCMERVQLRHTATHEAQEKKKRRKEFRTSNRWDEQEEGAEQLCHATQQEAQRETWLSGRPWISLHFSLYALRHSCFGVAAYWANKTGIGYHTFQTAGLVFSACHISGPPATKQKSGIRDRCVINLDARLRSSNLTRIRHEAERSASATTGEQAKET